MSNAYYDLIWVRILDKIPSQVKYMTSNSSRNIILYHRYDGRLLAKHYSVQEDQKGIITRIPLFFLASGLDSWSGKVTLPFPRLRHWVHRVALLAPIDELTPIHGH